MTGERATLGSDYNSSTVYLGLLKDKKVLAATSIDMTHPGRGMNMLRQMLHTYSEEYDVDKIWAEAAWVRASRFPKSGLMLSRTAAFIEVAAYDVGIMVEFVNPMTWRKAIYGHAHPANPKEVARAFVKEKFGFETRFKNQHDLCESILIAHYGQLIGNLHS